MWKERPGKMQTAFNTSLTARPPSAAAPQISRSSNPSSIVQSFFEDDFAYQPIPPPPPPAAVMEREHSNRKPYRLPVVQVCPRKLIVGC